MLTLFLALIVSTPWVSAASTPTCSTTAKAYQHETVTAQPRTLGYRLDHVGPVQDLTTSDMFHIREQLARHGAIYIPEQDLTAEDQVEFTRKLGEPVILPSSFEGNDPEPGQPAIHRVTNFWSNGTWKGETHSFGGYWHNDGDFHVAEKRRVVSLLYADEVNVEVGGQTGFADTLIENLELPKELLQMARTHAMYLDASDIPDFAKGTEEHLALYPRAVHNLIIPHVDTKQEHLYYGCEQSHVFPLDAEDYEAEELSKTESFKLLEAITAVVDKTKYKHQWKTGDLVIWDNTSVMHRSYPYTNDGSKRRMLYRTQAFVNTGLDRLKELDAERRKADVDCEKVVLKDSSSKITA